MIDEDAPEQVRVILLRKGQVLLLKSRRSPIDEHIGKWELPGGFVHYDEEPRDAVHREVKEEAGLVCKILFEMHTFDPDDADHVVRVFCAVVMGGRIRLSPEHSDSKWVQMDRIKYLTETIHHDKLIEYVDEAKEMLDHAGIVVS